ncbi:MAG: hypothetical protein ABIP03_14740 [Aquihabitans sp.]
MSYVMVPVPEEHVEEAMAAVLRIISRGRLIDWDAEGATALYEEVDESARSLLALVARATIAGKPLSQRAASDLMEISQREIAGLTKELAERSSAQSHPLIILNQSVTQTLPNGRTREAQVLQMTAAVAEFIRDAERTELANNPHPLTGIAE